MNTYNKNPEQGNLIVAQGLDPKAPYSLGNKDYFYERECNSGHKDLKDEEIAFAGGYYDGYNWTVPVCLRCIKEDKEYPHPNQHGHNTSVHLKEHIEVAVLRN